MSSDGKQPTADTSGRVKALFEECKRRQRELKPSNYEAVRKFLIRELSFDRLLFPRAPNLDGSELLIWQGQLHQALVTLLKKAPDDDTFWYLLTQWLRSEGIREPERVLSPGLLRRLTQDSRQRLQGFLQTDDYNVYLIRIWLPYTEPLLRKARWLSAEGFRNRRAELERSGYDSQAVDLVLQKAWNSTLEFTCQWIEDLTTRYRATTLRNSYSRVFGKTALSRMKCSFCQNQAENEFWADGKPVLHCKAHGPDQLPTCEENAWRDDTECRWWRDESDIRCSFPPV
jgi:hypothetical protein